jgi:hypothetical protein
MTEEQHTRVLFERATIFVLAVGVIVAACAVDIITDNAHHLSMSKLRTTTNRTNCNGNTKYGNHKPSYY